MENNTKQIALSTEQMDHLKELGCDTSSASMCHYLVHYSYNFGDTVYNEWGLDLKSGEFPDNFQGIPDNDGMDDAELRDVIPTFNLQDILELLPEFIVGIPLVIDIGYQSISYYQEGIDYVQEEIEIHIEKFDKCSLLDASYKMLCWVLENKYIKFNIKNKQ